MSVTLPKGRKILAISLCAVLAACQTTTGSRTTQNEDRTYCEREPVVCALIGALVVGGVVALAANSGGRGDATPPNGGGTGNGGASGLGNGGGNGGTTGDGNGTGDTGTGGGNFGTASDSRLKTDVQFVRRLEGGLNLYAFRYTGDDRVFVGVDASEIQADPRHAAAVVDLGNGFLGVDYRALGVVVVNPAEMRAAGDAAMRRASVS